MSFRVIPTWRALSLVATLFGVEGGVAVGPPSPTKIGVRHFGQLQSSPTSSRGAIDSVPHSWQVT